MKLSKYNVEIPYKGKVIVANSVSGGALSLNEEYAKQFHALKTSSDDVHTDLVKELIKGGMLVDDDCDEYKTLLLKSRIARFSSSSLSLTIAPTMACNFSCPYCYEKGQAYTTMSDRVKESLCEFVKQEFPSIGNLAVSWYGGEPLLCVDRIEDLTAGLKRAIPDGCAYAATIVTNGYLLTGEVADRLISCGVNSAQITIDGSKANHDARRTLHGGAPTYDVIMHNIQNCADKINVTVRVNVDSTNVRDVYELLDRFEADGLQQKVAVYLALVDNINETCPNDIHCMSVQEFSSDEMNFLHELVRRGFHVQLFPACNLPICGAVTLNSYVVDPIGDLYKCWDEIGMRERRIGSVADGGVSMNKRLVHWLSYEPLDQECGSCFAFPVCLGGCPHHALEDKSRYCSTLRYNAEQRFRLSGELYERIREASHV